MTGKHRGIKARRRQLAVRLLAAVGWGYTGQHRLAAARPRWTTPPGMGAPAAPVGPVHAGPALPTSRQSMAPRLSVVTVAHSADLAVASVALVAPERADDTVYARVDAERDEAAMAALANCGEQQTRHVA